MPKLYWLACFSIWVCEVMVKSVAVPVPDTSKLYCRTRHCAGAMVDAVSLINGGTRTCLSWF